MIRFCCCRSIAKDSHELDMATTTPKNLTTQNTTIMLKFDVANSVLNNLVQ